MAKIRKNFKRGVDKLSTLNSTDFTSLAVHILIERDFQSFRE